MSIFKNHAEINKTWRGLPNTKNVASYNYVDQVVLFESIESKHVISCISKLTPAERWPLKREVWLNGFHEYTHWLDMTSSVFGLRWLCKMVNLLEKYSKETESRSTAYVEECKAAARDMAGIHLPEYYSTVENPVGPPWKYSSTVGKAYDSEGNSNPFHPLWFVRFDTPSGMSIARQPISVASLLEVRAVAAEITGGFGLINALHDRSFKVLQQQRLSHEIFSRVYQPHLTVYSAAAHWYANHRGLSEVLEAYIAASKLAWFCLDAPTRWVTSIKATAEFKARFGDPFATMMQTSLSRDDRGALFFMLAAETSLKLLKTLNSDLDALLRKEWKVSLGEVNAEGEKERAELVNRLVSTPEPVRSLAEIWKTNLGQRYMDRPLSVVSENIQLPAVILADDTPLEIFNMRMGDDAFDNRTFDPRPYFDEFFKAHLAMSKYGGYSDKGAHCFSVAPA